MPKHHRLHAMIFTVLLLVQVFAPISFAAEPNTPKINADTSVDLDLLNTVGIQNSGEISNGWFDSANGVGNIDLLYRDAAVIATENGGTDEMVRGGDKRLVIEVLLTAVCCQRLGLQRDNETGRRRRGNGFMTEPGSLTRIRRLMALIHSSRELSLYYVVEA